MKKSLLYIGMALALASCGSDTYEDWADPQHSSESAATVALSVSPADPIKFAEVTTDSVRLFAPHVTAANGAVNQYTVTLYNADKTASKQLTAAEDGYVATAELSSAYYDLYGRRPVTRTAALDVVAYTTISGQSIKNEGATTASLLAEAPELSSKGYYLVGNVQTPNVWNADDTSLTLDNGGQDPYENPIYTITVAAPAGGGNLEFKVLDLDHVGNWDYAISASTDGGAVTPDGKSTGTLGYKNVGGNLTVTGDADAKYYNFTFNMLDGTYTVQALAFQPTLFLAGSCNGWNQIDYLTTNTYDGKYTGYMYLDQGGFKFCTQQNWDGTNYGEDFNTAGDAGNIVMSEEAGYYKVDVDLLAKTYTLTPITTIGLIGTASAGGWDVSTPMTYDKDARAWVLKNVTLNSGELKFRANDGWDINWGGTTAALVQNGANLQVEAGTYDITLYAWADGYASCTMTKK